MAKVGFIGLGIMGSRMAQNLLAQDVALIVYNRTPDKAMPLVEAGAKLAETPREAAAADIVFTMVAHPEAVTDVALGPEGFLDHLAPGALWVDCSTVHPQFAREMAAAAAARQVHHVDAPAAGTKPQAANAELVFFVGGEDEDVARCRPYLQMMGRRVVHAGDHGMGTALKMVVNTLLGAAMAAFAESVKLGRALGLDQETLFEALIGGPVVAPFVAAKREKMEQDCYDPQFPLKWMRKDLHMVATAAYDAEVAMPLAALTGELYQQAVAAGFGDLDFSAIYRQLNDK